MPPEGSVDWLLGTVGCVVGAVVGVVVGAVVGFVVGALVGLVVAAVLGSVVPPTSALQPHPVKAPEIRKNAKAIEMNFIITNLLLILSSWLVSLKNRALDREFLPWLTKNTQMRF